ncbi:MAG: threonine-phosphate decarboxylase [Oscillospiraceae bacterium]
MINYRHGGDVYSNIIDYDFSANINPLGLPENVRKTLFSSVDSFSAYPDPECRELVKAISCLENIPPEKILCGNGAADLIFRIVFAVKPSKALILSPTFSEYEKSLLSVGCEIEYHFLFEENHFRLDENILEKLTEDTDIFFLCNPNNPTGNIISPELLRLIIKKCAEQKILLIIDECFMDFVFDSEKLSAKNHLESGVVILKAFTKIYAMAGLRLGYIVCDNTAFLEKIRRFGQPWSVSTPAQLAGITAASELDYRQKTVRIIASEREFLISELTQLGLKAYPSKTNFLLFKSAVPLEEKLLKQRIAIRSCSNFSGLGDDFYRIAVRLHHENLVLMKAIEGIVKNG